MIAAEWISLDFKLRSLAVGGPLAMRVIGIVSILTDISMQECVSEFISFITSEASERCQVLQAFQNTVHIIKCIGFCFSLFFFSEGTVCVFIFSMKLKKRMLIG
jgi:hypothetical protein